MKKIRKNVFETNSSSSHSITLGDMSSFKKDRYGLKSCIDENNNLVLNGGEFGWYLEDDEGAETKANYVAIALTYYSEGAKEHGSSYGFTLEEITNIVSLFSEVIREETGAEVVFNFKTGWDDENYSYIDHQSIDVLAGELYGKNDGEIKDFFYNFIFNENSILDIDNDNH